jgi:S-adenosylmethionine:tRNA ribosyltransferase-isomerase
MNNNLLTDNYTYTLPDNLVAQKPLAGRANSKLLVYKNGTAEHHQFNSLESHLPSDADLFFNNAKVIPARTHFKRSTGAVIEIFILHPSNDQDIQIVLENTSEAAWVCLIRNLKKWKDGELLESSFEIGKKQIPIRAKLQNRESMEVLFQWESGHSFSEVLQALGDIPLPPYIKRQSNEADKESYQTVYADKEGAVAAPTAGLHFTNEVQYDLAEKGIKSHYLTLHVGAGTFKPVSSDRIDLHTMHREHFEMDKASLEALSNSNFRVAVGTTSLRTLESIYWIGVKLAAGQNDPFYIEQHIVANSKKQTLTYLESIQVILDYLEKNRMQSVKASTSIMIYPGYSIKSIDALITNFHLPKSTLIMLIAACIGDAWQDIYTEAIKKDYRFLSYGDSSLLFL